MNRLAKIGKLNVFFLGIFSLLMVSFPIDALSQNTSNPLIVSVTSARTRSEPNTQSDILQEYDIGSVVTPIAVADSWYEIEISPPSESENAQTGWISNSVVANFDPDRPDATFLEIGNRYAERGPLDLGSTKQLLAFLNNAADESKTYQAGGELRLLRLHMLAKYVGNIDYDKSQQEPNAAFFKEHQGDLIYHEPAGIWIIRSDRFWQLHARYKSHKVGETIAWYAAKNPLPGECEGYVVCHLNYIRRTTGEYLNFYPNGKHSKEAMEDIRKALSPIALDSNAKVNYSSAVDITDRAEMNRILSELRTIVSRLPFQEKSVVIKQIETIAEGHR